MLERLLPFLGAIAVLVAIPGPAIILVMKSAVLRGRRSAITTALGTFCADVVWVAASIAGLTALLATSRPLFEVLRFVGAAYLIYLGVRLLTRRRHGAMIGHPVDQSRPRATRHAYREGLLSELSNPKTLIIFTSIIPPFLPPHATGADVALYGGLFAVIGLVSCLIYASVFSASRRLVAPPRRTDLLLRGSGGVLTTFGVGLAIEGLREASSG